MLLFTDKELRFARNIGCEVLVGEIKGINLGLYFPEVWTKEGRVASNGVCVHFPHIKKTYVQEYGQVRIVGVEYNSSIDLIKAFTGQFVKIDDGISSSEDLMCFLRERINIELDEIEKAIL